MTTRADYDTVIVPTYAPPAPVFVRGAGARVWDEEGREYVDFGGGIAVLSLGHCPAVLTGALAAQAAQLMHVSNLHVNAVAVQAAQTLTAHTFAERVFWCNSGAEANEAALKLARRRGAAQRASKVKVLAFENGFHGRIGFPMAATPQEKVRAGFGDLAPGFYTTPYNVLPAAAAQMDDDFCAIIVEPVQGEGGVNVATAEFLQGLRTLADQHDALLIFDEIQSGVGRCGTLYAYMQSDLTPDVLTTAKGLGGGFPVAAMLATEQAAAVLTAGTHGTTYGGNALATRAAETVLQQVLSEGFLAGVAERAAEFASRLHHINEKHNCFAAVRQSGLLIGCDLTSPRQVQALVAACLQQGLVVLSAGTNALRLAPALNIPQPDIVAGFERLEKALRAA